MREVKEWATLLTVFALVLMRQILFTAFIVLVLGFPGMDAFACLIGDSCGCHQTGADHDEAATDQTARKPCCPTMRKAYEDAQARREAAADRSRTGLQSEHHDCCCDVDQPVDTLQAQNDFRLEVERPSLQANAAATPQLPIVRPAVRPARIAPYAGPPDIPRPSRQILNCVWRA